MIRNHNSSYDLYQSFDQSTNRANTASLKYDGRLEMFGKAEIAPLWVADMDFSAPLAVTQALVDRANHPVYGYTLYPNSLYEALIDWLKRRHSWQIKHEWVVLCPGVVSSLHAAVMTFTEPGESVIIQPPIYAPFFSAVTNTGRQIIENPLHLKNGRYTIDFDHLEQCAKHARLLLFCSPHNPVGRVWSKLELGHLLDIARKYNLIIFSDEIHSDLIYSENKHHTLAMLAGESVDVITAVAPSKTFNIPGLNLAALVVSDKKRRASIIRTLEISHVSAANPFSIVAFEAAYREGETWLNALIIYLGDTRDYVEKYLATYLPVIRLIKPEGTYLLWLDCRELGMSDSQLNHFFVHDANVGMSPGILFGKEGSRFMRMNIGFPRSVIRKALDNIKIAGDRIMATINKN